MPRPGPRGPRPGYGPAPRRRHRGRAWFVLFLLAATVAAGAYFYLGRQGSSGSTSTTGGDFVTVANRIAAGARTVEAEAQGVQRFTELAQFRALSDATVYRMGLDRDRLIKASKTATGAKRQLADQAANAATQAIGDAIHYTAAIALTENLTKAEAARQDLLAAATTLELDAKAWQRS